MLTVGQVERFELVFVANAYNHRICLDELVQVGKVFDTNILAWLNGSAEVRQVSGFHNGIAFTLQGQRDLTG